MADELGKIEIIVTTEGLRLATDFSESDTNLVLDKLKMQLVAGELQQVEQ